MKLIIVSILYDIILTDVNICRFYNKKYTNSKFSLVSILDEIIHMLKSGVSWRNLRSNINYRTIYYHFHRFVKNDIFYKAFCYIRTLYCKRFRESNITVIDSTFIQNKFGKNKIGRNKFFKNKNCNKVSLIIDSNKFPLSVLVDVGNKHDISFTLDHMKDLNTLFYTVKSTNKTLLADKAYESKDLRSTLYQQYKTNLMIPPKSNANIVYNFNKETYNQRIYIEHTFSFLKTFKRINMRFDSNIDTFSNLIFLAFSCISLALMV